MNNEDKPGSTSTVESALQYVDTPTSGFASWKIKDLGLQFLLFGIAELNAKRVVRLAQKVYDLEEIVFSEDNLRGLDPRGVLSAYKMGTDALKEATEYIAKTRKEMDWTSINSQLGEMTANKGTDENVDINKIANKLLEAMTYKKPENGEE